MRRRRRLLFIVVTVTISLCMTLAVAELILRVQAASVRSSESMTPGLIEYDRRLGWRLQANWKGRHEHRDFAVRYQIPSHGFRGPWPHGERSGECIALVGDSFTFGLGVEDDAVFARLLESNHGQGERQVLNLGVPGYSTDQELLLLEDVISRTPIDHVIVVVCLINDVLDNQRLFPLQAMQGKPRFLVSENGTLRLDNVPVPTNPKTAADMRQNLASLVIGDLPAQQGAVKAWLGRTEIARRLGLFQPTFAAPPGFFEDRFRGALELFDALAERGRQVSEEHGASFTIALLPGRSFVQDPDGYSANYQEFLRRSLLERIGEAGIPVIDLALPLRQSYDSGEGTFFHPNDGHLDPAGHAKVAALIEAALATGSAMP